MTAPWNDDQYQLLCHSLFLFLFQWFALRCEVYDEIIFFFLRVVRGDSFILLDFSITFINNTKKNFNKFQDDGTFIGL
jgi:hypothetical protein